jgi:hypothetical protein
MQVKSSMILASSSMQPNQTSRTKKAKCIYDNLQRLISRVESFWEKPMREIYAASYIVEF